MTMTARPPFIEKRLKLLIDGEHVDAAAGRTIEVTNPATEERIAEVAEADAADVDLAVAAARRSFDRSTWRGMTGDARARVMWRIAELMDQNREELALLETLNNGMALASSRGSVAGAASWMRYFAGATTRIGGKAVSGLVSAPGEYHAYTRSEPVGVARLITPWNGPLSTLIIKLAPALAAGCSVVAKPSELTPLTALRLGDLALEAGLPPAC